MGRTVADQFVATLAAAGIKRIYGIVGGSLNGLTDAVRRRGAMDWIHAMHEEAAAFAAGAEAHLTGKLALCAGSCGPGNLHLIIGLFDCHRSRVPVPGIAAHIPSAEVGSGYFQETYPQTLYQECSHYRELVTNANQLPRAFEVAIREATGKRGVSVLVLPGEVALQPAADAPPVKLEGLLPPVPIVTPSKHDLDRLAALLIGCDRTTILCGSGFEGAHDELLSGDTNRKDDDDFDQAGTLVRKVMDETQRDRLVPNGVGHLNKGVSEPVLVRAFEYRRNIDRKIGERIADRMRRTRQGTEEPIPKCHRGGAVKSAPPRLPCRRRELGWHTALGPPYVPKHHLLRIAL